MGVLFSSGWLPLMLLAIISAASASAANAAPSGSCKCIPGDQCWPPNILWDFFNFTVGGNSIRTQPVALSCCPGPASSPAQCTYVDANWNNATLQAANVVGLSYPTNISCPPVNATAGESAQGSRTLGVSPSYAANCTNPQQVALTVVFSKLFNIRLAVRNTGHDQLGRSERSNGLEVWIRHLRNGITFQNTFESSTGCTTSNWTGSAFKVAGGYSWGDGAAEAQKHNVVIVTGGTPSVLELAVVLADGSLVAANGCLHSDLFVALCGGGGGTYGVVVSSTVKAHPTVNVTVQHLAIPAPLFADVTTDYVHGFAIFNAAVAHAQSAFDATRAKLAKYNLTSVFISEGYVSYPDYWTYYHAESGSEPPVSLPAALRTMIETIAGTLDQFTTNNLELVGGGQVFRDASEPYSGVTPVWRISYFNSVVARVSSLDTPQAVLDEKQHDITYVKVPATKRLAPTTGAYMNETSRFDPD
ncbi:uncharacterized protein Z519_10538 [Cladophialophora bantiana CBS 173.52]|uniref:FAD-binding PCMH-type domain-containing protein n=1 Tax=Cladophialophora bantiana (strain ATCC 10958 / CBS 173.52 / CDC B-1940 / NIH 8579) TaxID=1442370 RepID=A0A0D2H710_CLAB1|nr:uncharacterized protein Z519_10538 [Cladophialophora bantiana CBS 173.52]KIW89053.1 hypothetical protein Z519_10538 [Cladophialophora bantiana CBS 173.52]